MKIENEEQYLKACDTARMLMDEENHDPKKLNTMLDTISDYEDIHYPIDPSLSPEEIAKKLIDNYFDIITAHLPKSNMGGRRKAAKACAEHDLNNSLEESMVNDPNFRQNMVRMEEVKSNIVKL